jgi:hypothetical protein
MTAKNGNYVCIPKNLVGVIISGMAHNSDVAGVRAIWKQLLRVAAGTLAAGMASRKKNGAAPYMPNGSILHASVYATYRGKVRAVKMEWIQKAIACEMCRDR